jgi:hypothetical protein
MDIVSLEAMPLATLQFHPINTVNIVTTCHMNCATATNTTFGIGVAACETPPSTHKICI